MLMVVSVIVIPIISISIIIIISISIIMINIIILLGQIPYKLSPPRDLADSSFEGPGSLQRRIAKCL